MYTVPPAASGSSTPHTSLATSSSLWHLRPDHPGPAVLDTLRNNSSIECNKGSHTLCHSCQLGKHVQLPFSSSSSHNTSVFELIHCDVWTSPVASVSGCCYYLVILDDYSHFCWTFPMVHKSKVAGHIISFFAYARTQFSLLIKNVQADNGTDFVNKTHLFFDGSGHSPSSLLSIHFSPKRQSLTCPSHP
jgi:hypothetical protein